MREEVIGEALRGVLLLRRILPVEVLPEACAVRTTTAMADMPILRRGVEGGEHGGVGEKREGES